MHSKKCNLFFRVTALLTACFIVIGMSGIQTLAESGGNSDAPQTEVTTEEGGSENQNQAKEEEHKEDSAGAGGSLEENEKPADAGFSSSNDEKNGETGDSSTESTSDVAAESSTESASDASTESSSEDAAEEASTEEAPQVLGAPRLKKSLVISNGQIIFANDAEEENDYRWDKDNLLRTRDEVTISVDVNVEAVDPSNPQAEKRTSPAIYGVYVEIEYKNIETECTTYAEMHHAGNGTYTYTFPSNVAAYEIIKITAEDIYGVATEDSYSKEDASGKEKENNIFRNISIEKDHFIGTDSPDNSKKYIANSKRCLVAGEYASPAYEDSDWISLQGEEDPSVSLTVFFTGWFYDSGNFKVSLVPVDESGKEVAGTPIAGTIKSSGCIFCPYYEITFDLPDDKDQYQIYKLKPEGDCWFNIAVNSVNADGLIYVKIDSTSPVVKDIEVTYDEDDDGDDKGVSGTYKFGEGQESVVYAKRDLTLTINTSNSYDPSINEANAEVSTASGLSKLQYVIYDDLCPYGSEIKEIEISDKAIDECENIKITLPYESQNQGPVKIGSVALVDEAGNLTYVIKGDTEDENYNNYTATDRIEPVSYVIDSVVPVIRFTELEGEELGDGYPTDLASTTYFFNHDISGKLTVEERYIKEVTLSERDGGKKPGLSGQGEENHELEAASEYTFTSNGDGDYIFSAKAEDMSGNISDPVDGPCFVIDSTAPVITVTYTVGGENVKPEGKDKSYYKDTVYVEISIEEKHLLEEGIDAVITGTKADGTAVELKVTEWNHSEGSDHWTARVELSDDGEYALRAVATDRAGNTSDTYEGPGFTIDRTIPVVTITFDNNSAKNGYYYNASRTATITVKDYTFDSSKCELTMNAPDNLPAEGEWAAAGDQTYVKTVAFTKDGRYDFSFKTTDKAGNESETHTISLFIIDTTAPVVTVTYDNNDVKNTYYYKDVRKATIKVDEMSFDETLVDVKSQASDDDTPMAELPKLTTFAANETKNVYTSSMSFAKDGKYGYTIVVEDLAGNKSEIFTSDIFVIDTTVPDITFTGVENYSANNGVVAPVLIYKDLNIDFSNTTVVMKGANHGEVTPESKQSTVFDTVTITYSDFTHDKDTDDLYTLSVKITDLAGNVAEEELVFSVNRFGSVYVISESTQELTEQYYTNEPQDVTITEINVDSLTYKEVSVDRDGDSEVLKEGKDYTVTVQGNDKSWKSMTYTVKADNFKKDGNYSVMVYSKDRATNTQDNRSAEKEIEFAVDKTAPSIVTSGIEEEGVYEEEGHDFIINVSDNMGFESLVVYVGQDKLEELVSFTDEDIEKQGGTLTISLPEDDKYQNVMILATDVAGNQSEKDFNNVLVSRQAKKIIEEEEVSKNDEIKPIVEPAPDPFKIWVAVAGGVVGASGCAGAGVYFWRKKKLGVEPKTKQ